MKIPNYQVIQFDQWSNIFEKALELEINMDYLPSKHQVELSLNHKWLAKIFLPWDYLWTNNSFQKIDDFHLVLVAIKAGQAFTGYFHNHDLIDHKVFRAYMVRQKQGKSQIKHLKTKGKSRAGSRIRLAETERFFLEINERLNFYADQFPITRWGISCSKTLWPYFFDAELTPPFTSKQENLISIPFHYQQASFEELQKSYHSLIQFHLLLSEDGKRYFGEGLDGNDVELEDDNW
ncbi:hypothetical protein E4S40_03410 [Algoriphagus kandeliae]|uniref:VLRF1 domain-containing protein n=1 Tax=Algoriphagus kandeliae TaxID=2562278 RepID=A0A4Y9R258_9BACT|nr:hypothetical protein [Algoriphagus kandeliae]TFV97703.1 hypothetical protein E4S40_03410 [Algoriphagus kandeliae]